MRLRCCAGGLPPTAGESAFFVPPPSPQTPGGRFPWDRGAVARYGVALASLALAWLLRELLMPVLGHRMPFMLFILAVVGSSWYVGLRPGLLATGVGLLGATFSSVEPRCLAG